jgi:uncharacterized membrane protein YgcG
MKKLLVKALISQHIGARLVLFPLEVLSCLVPVFLILKILIAGLVLSTLIPSMSRHIEVMAIGGVFVALFIQMFMAQPLYFLRFSFYRKGMDANQKKWLMEAKGKEFNTRLGILKSAYLGLNTGIKLNSFNPYQSSITNSKGELTPAYRKEWIEESGLAFASMALFAGSIAALPGIYEFAESHSKNSDLFDQGLSSSDFEQSNPFWESSVNIDGSPMTGGVDIHGNTYGVTNDSFGHDSFGNDSFGNDSFGGGFGGGGGFD